MVTRSRVPIRIVAVRVQLPPYPHPARITRIYSPRLPREARCCLGGEKRQPMPLSTVALLPMGLHPGVVSNR
jgi:hypothetical protein